MQVRFVQEQQMRQPTSRFPDGVRQSRQFGVGLRIRSVRGSQSRPRPAPAHTVQMAPHARTREHQAEALRQERRQQRDRPASLDMPGARWRLTGLRGDDLGRQWVFGRASTTRFIFQSRDPVLLIAMQPGAHDIFATVVNGADLADRKSPITEQHHLRAQRDPPDAVPADGSQFAPLMICQGDVDHTPFLLPSPHAQIVPFF
jgi:hypothetical protein